MLKQVFTVTFFIFELAQSQFRCDVQGDSFELVNLPGKYFWSNISCPEHCRISDDCFIEAKAAASATDACIDQRERFFTNALKCVEHQMRYFAANRDTLSQICHGAVILSNGLRWLHLAGRVWRLSFNEPNLGIRNLARTISGCTLRLLVGRADATSEVRGIFEEKMQLAGHIRKIIWYRENISTIQLRQTLDRLYRALMPFQVARIAYMQLFIDKLWHLS
jgi:hypothetical protein